MDLNDDDVISMELRESLTSSPTFLVKELMQKWRARFQNQNPQPELFYFSEKGVKCRMLTANGEGWREGRVRFKLEFIPDRLPEIEDKNASATDIYPLDGLRSQLKIE